MLFSLGSSQISLSYSYRQVFLTSEPPELEDDHPVLEILSEEQFCSQRGQRGLCVVTEDDGVEAEGLQKYRHRDCFRLA